MMQNAGTEIPIWMEQPDKCIPEKLTILNVIKWHIAIMHLMETKHREAQPELYAADMDIPTLADYGTTPETEALHDRDQRMFYKLGYHNVSLIETAMLIGRELWYQNYNNSSQYNDELSQIDITDLDAWMDVFEVPRSLADGEKLTPSIEYTISKTPDFLQAYIDKVESLQRGVTA